MQIICVNCTYFRISSKYAGFSRFKLDFILTLHWQPGGKSCVKWSAARERIAAVRFMDSVSQLIALLSIETPLNIYSTVSGPLSLKGLMLIDDVYIDSGHPSPSDWLPEVAGFVVRKFMALIISKAALNRCVIYLPENVQAPRKTIPNDTRLRGYCPRRFSRICFGRMTCLSTIFFIILYAL